ncbi:MAG: tetratricopeptide repeat protein [Treponema sp.]|nr:tetratricopeptide repeat protein [Treponema sp.]
MTKTRKSIFMVIVTVLMLCGCTKSSKTIIRMQKMEEGVGSPTTKEELQEAIKKYQDRVYDMQIAQGQIGIWYKMLGTRYLDTKMYGEALKCFQKAIELYPDNQNLFYWVGVCAGYMAKASLDFEATGATTSQRYNYLKLAESAYRRAIELDERYGRALYGLAIIYIYEMGEVEKGIPYLERFLDIEKRNTDAMFRLAEAYYLNYDFDKAADLYDRIISLTKDEKKKALAEQNKKTVLDAAYTR